MSDHEITLTINGESVTQTGSPVVPSLPNVAVCPLPEASATVTANLATLGSAASRM